MKKAQRKNDLAKKERLGNSRNIFVFSKQNKIFYGLREVNYVERPFRDGMDIDSYIKLSFCNSVGFSSIVHCYFTIEKNVEYLSFFT